MKLSIEKHDLQRGLGRIQSVVEKRNTMPILADVLMQARKEKSSSVLELAATDLEIGIRSVHEADVKTAGGLTVSAKKLYEIVRELSDEPIQLEVAKEAYLTVTCGRATFTLAGNAAEEYPTLPSFSAKGTVNISALVLSDMIERTVYAASTDETRYNLNGVYLESLAETGKIRMVATDGHRLGYVDRELGLQLEGFPQGVIIPRKALAEIKRLLDEDVSEDLELGFEGNSGLARLGSVTLVMRLIEGEFPNYRQVIPEEITHTITIATEGLVRALRRVVLLSNERSRAVKLELREGELSLTSNNPDLGEAQDILDIDFAGEGLTIAFNARYLLDCLAVVKAKEVRLALKDSLSPMRVSPADDDDVLAVVMPMRL